ncbi:MAG TPA: SPOR domain-containing protein [Bacteroidales bacterium]|jgi:hypothetical protein|nr:SPOR domain-containing protein [Bacteroidales bacterium]
MNKTFFSVLAIVLLLVNFSFAQNADHKAGKITVIQDNRLTSLTEKYKEVNRRDPSFDGYRLQIFFDSGNNSKYRATEALTAFQEKYPNVKAYLSFKQPNYRIRAGNFRTKSEAIGFQKSIQSDYPNAFVVRDKILFSEMD